MTPKQLNEWRVIPRLLIITFIIMNLRVVESCPPANIVFPMLLTKLKEGEIKGYYVNCHPVNLTVIKSEST